jgi:hypothetical protein
MLPLADHHSTEGGGADGAAYSSWDSGVERVEGRIAPGETINMREEYSGPMLPMIWRSMPDLGPSFTQFANGLKQRAENAR